MTGALTLLRQPHPPAAIPIPEMTADQCIDVIIDTGKTMATATWRRVLTDPVGQVVEIGRRRFASPGTAEFVRIRDRFCRMPGCNTPAVRAEIDHTVRHADDGVSVVGNLAALCKHTI